VPDKESGGRAHPSSYASVGRCCAVAFDDGGAGTMVADDRGVPLQLGGGQ
jgi:hypothetical protein